MGTDEQTRILEAIWAQVVECRRLLELMLDA